MATKQERLRALSEELDSLTRKREGLRRSLMRGRKLPKPNSEWVDTRTSHLWKVAGVAHNEEGGQHVIMMWFDGSFTVFKMDSFLLNFRRAK